MDDRKVIYYTDEMNDEFSTTEITPRKIDENYVYIHHSAFKRFTHFFWYRIVATPIACAYVRLTFGHQIRGRQKFEKHKADGYFMYGNHTQDIADPFIPNMINFPKTNYVIVHPNNVSMPVLGKINRYIGAMPLPGNIAAAQNFKACMEKQIKSGNCVVIYPEAHIWPYYTKIRPFPDTSFAYPVKLDAPVFSFTNTYQKRRFFRKPKIVTYIDGPFFPDVTLSPSVRKKALRDKVYETMCERAKKSDVEYIKYVKKEA